MKEYNILQNINNEDIITQRQLAQKTGMSLGNVNILLKRLINKGLVKIEHLNARSMRYILTPKGIQEKAKLTYKYIVNSYNYIVRIEQLIDEILAKTKAEKIYLYGKKDEIYHIICNKLANSKVKIQRTENIADLELDKTPAPVIITWEPEYTQKLAEKGIDAVDILSSI